MQSGTEAPDRPVLFVDATRDPTAASPTPTPLAAPSTPTRPSHSSWPAPTVPTPASGPDQAAPTCGASSGGLDPIPPPLPQQQGLSGPPPPGMPLRDWIKHKKRSAAATGGSSAAFPSVQVYCPCGSSSLDRSSPQAPATSHREQTGSAPNCSSDHGVHDSNQLHPASQDQSADTRYAEMSCYS